MEISQVDQIFDKSKILSMSEVQKDRLNSVKDSHCTIFPSQNALYDISPIFRNYDGTTCIIRSACTIRKGEEITDNYGLFFQIKNEDQRQEVLSKQYFFQCQCIACKQQWPTFPEFRGQISSFICSGCRAPQQTGANKGLAKKCAKCKKDLKPLHQAIKLLSR